MPQQIIYIPSLSYRVPVDIAKSFYDIRNDVLKLTNRFKKMTDCPESVGVLVLHVDDFDGYVNANRLELHHIMICGDMIETRQYLDNSVLTTAANSVRLCLAVSEIYWLSTSQQSLQ